MKIAVIAANGRTGKVFVERALEAGHEVVAGIHSSGSFEPHEKLTVQKCDATNGEQVQQLIQGTDAVVSFIGHVRGSKADVQTAAMRVLAEVMNRSGVRRLVSLTGTGVRQAGDKVGLVDLFLNTTIKIIDPNRIQDGITHAAFLQQTSLDFTILRVLKLQNVEPSPFALSLHGPTKWFVGRADVAKAALQVLEGDAFIRQMPILSRVPKR